LALAEKLNITVSEQNLRISGINVKSGLCRVKGKDLFIMDKNKSVYKKNKILARCLSKMSYDDIYIVPAIRDFLQKFSDD
jgi:hypothetical protein